MAQVPIHFVIQHMDTLSMLEPPFFTDQHALFLDFDGTLVGIAPHPSAIHRPLYMPQLLLHTQQILGGALAIVTGRSIADIDHFLAPLEFAVAGEHGAHRRDTQGHLHHTHAWAAAQTAYMLRAAQLLQIEYPALWCEVKTTGFTLHYRSAPGLGQACWDTLAPLATQTPACALIRGKYGIELRPSDVGKGVAVRSYMQESVFAGRKPVFVGDDVADEDGFDAAQRAGGYGIKVGSGPTAARYRADGPADVREWLQRLVSNTMATP
jgi:trehalose 6-phosphate phosphatase